MRSSVSRSSLTAFILGASCLTAPAFAQEADEGGYNDFYVGGSFGGAVQGNDRNSRIRFDRNLDGVFGDAVTTAVGGDAFGPGFCNGRAVGNSAAFGCRNDKDGIEYYARTGIDSQTGNIVVGIVGEFGRPEITDSVTAFSSTPASYTMTRSVRYQGAVRGRLGFTPQGTTLFYATGGATYSRIKNRFTTTNTANAFSTNGNRWNYGWQAGGGVEQKIGENFSIGLEYIYNDVTDRDARTFVRAGTAGPTNPFLLAGAGGTDFRRSDDSFRWHSGRVTATFRF